MGRDDIQSRENGAAAALRRYHDRRLGGRNRRMWSGESRGRRLIFFAGGHYRFEIERGTLRYCSRRLNLEAYQASTSTGTRSMSGPRSLKLQRRRKRTDVALTIDHEVFTVSFIKM